MRISIVLFTVLSMCPRPGEATGPIVTKLPDVTAHRGSSADRPENTLASTHRAIEAGATMIEVDVRTTRDGHLVLLHDATLDRTTTGRGPVNGRRLSEIRQLDAGSWFDHRHKDQCVPTLGEVLIVCRNKIDVLLDLKESGETYDRQVANEVKAKGDPQRTVVGVRSVKQARRFRTLLPQARQLGLIATPDQIEAYVAAGVETIRLWPKWLVDPSIVGRVRQAGAKLHLNGTVGTAEEIVPLLRYGPDSLSSDDPARLVETLRKPDRLRVEHLESIDTPTLILQGERDTLGNAEEVASYRLSRNVAVRWLPDGDHSFKPRKVSGYTQEENWNEGVETIHTFIESTA